MNKKEMIEVTNEIIELFSDAERWTQGYNARNQYGDITNPTSKAACRWCLNGAIVKLLEEPSEYIMEVQNFLGNIINFNDKYNRTAEQVVSKLKEFRETL